MNVAELLQNVYAKQNGLRLAKLFYQERLASDFSPFEFIEVDEMRLSSILAWLLNPRGSHSQGGRFLHGFVSKLHGETVDPAWSLQACENAEVRTEVSTKGGRIDILVRSRDRTLVIENKAGAGDGENQVANYFGYLDGLRQEGALLVYLTPKGENPSVLSISECQREKRIDNGQIHCWSYLGKTLDWLSSCRVVCRADRVSIFIDEFCRHIRDRFEGASDMAMQDQLVDEVLKSPETVSAALEVSLAIGMIRGRLLKKLQDQLVTEVAVKGWVLHWTLPEAGGDPGPNKGFTIDFGSEFRFGFGLRFVYGGFNVCRYGIYVKSGNQVSASDLANIEREAGQGGRVIPMGAHLGPTYVWLRTPQIGDAYLTVEEHWGQSSLPWVAISNNQMSKQIVDAASSFEGVLKRVNDG